jgi:hypothetical protein
MWPSLDGFPDVRTATGAATHGGVEVDLLDEVVHRATDDFWSYASFACIQA